MFIDLIIFILRKGATYFFLRREYVKKIKVEAAYFVGLH